MFGKREAAASGDDRRNLDRSELVDGASEKADNVSWIFAKCLSYPRREPHFPLSSTAILTVVEPMSIQEYVIHSNS